MYKKVKAESIEFVDKCTARWFFEKVGVQLYNQALDKCPTELKAKFRQIRDQEKEHQEILENVIRNYGSEPYAITPAVKITRLESEGLVKVIQRENFRAVMDALLNIELVDNANWEFLILMADALGDSDTRSKFKAALDVEQDHLNFIRDQNLAKSLESLKAA